MKNTKYKTLKKTQKEAFECGENKYFPGKRCKHGHVAPRWTISNACVECVSKRSKERYARLKKLLEEHKKKGGNTKQ
jgi:hypothetical protein